MFETIFIPSLVVVSTALVSLVIFTTTSSSEFMAFIAYVGLSVLSYFMTNSMIPQIGLLTIKAEIFGYDINKQGKTHFLTRHSCWENQNSRINRNSSCYALSCL